MGVVANPRSYGKQVPSYACRMLREITARHNDESGDERAIDGQCVLRVVDGGRSVLRRKKLRMGIIVSALYDGTESQDIQFPTLKDIIKFERLNKVSVNIYIIEGQKTLNILSICV